MFAVGFGLALVAVAGFGLATPWDGLFAALAFVAGSVGVGLVVDRMVTPAIPTGLHAAPVGIAAMLILMLVLGQVGPLGRGVTAITIGVGCLGLWLAPGSGLVPAGRLKRSDDPFVWVAVLLIAGAALVAIAAAQTAPGILWRSEFGAYDTLSYHLQLPKEWLAMGRVAPVEHNVYSFLPGAMEAAFAQVGALVAPGSIGGGDGRGALAAQHLHMLIWFVGAMAVFRAAKLGGASTRGAWLGSAVFCLTPWLLVTGTLAYNDAAVAALGAGAIGVSLDDRIGPRARAGLAALLVGAACGAKPTAIFMLAPAVGLVLLGRAERRMWAGMLGVGLVVGALSVGPWLIRNWLAAGNPVFPAATGLFGTGWWSDEQVARFAAGHRFDGSLLDRLKLMVLPDPNDPAGARMRGLLHPQWFAFFPAMIVAVVLVLRAETSRRLGALLAVGIALQLVAWLALTHIQSRFLVPCAAGGAVLLAVAARGRVGSVAIIAAVIAQAVGLGLVVHREPATWPNTPGAEVFNGSGWVKREFAAATDREQAELLAQLPPSAVVNLVTPEDTVVCLVGEARPFYFERDTVYATTWDAHPLAEAMRSAPEDPVAWTRSLAELGVTHVVINGPEIARLGRSGWLDPALTPVRIQNWLVDGGLRPVFGWEDTRTVLVAMPTADELLESEPAP